jgi:APA family basic amino acid/polyamine antiporter
VNPRFQTPGVATAVVGCAAAVIAGLLPIQILGEMVSIGTLLVFAVVCASVLLLRFKMPSRARPFRVPAAAIVCPAGVLVCVGMMLFLPAATWMRLWIWTLLGAAVFGVMKYRKRALITRSAPQAS